MNPPVPGLDQLVGEWLTVPDVAERLDLDVTKVHRQLQERRFVAVRRGERPVLSVPAAFFVAGHLANPAAPSKAQDAPAWTVLAALQGTLSVLADVGFSDEGAIEWLFTPTESLGTSPIEALRAGRKTEVRRLAQAEL
ncbi:Rv2175c family DNA-binding protein [Cellulomonas soli]